MAAAVGCFTSGSLAPTFTDGVGYCCSIHIVVSNNLLCRPAHARHRHGDRALQIAKQGVVCVPSIRAVEDSWDSDRHTHYSRNIAVHTAVAPYQRNRRPMLMLSYCCWVK